MLYIRGDIVLERVRKCIFIIFYLVLEGFRFYYKLVFFYIGIVWEIMFVLE